MKLWTTAAITSLLVSLPAAALVTLGVERWRARDLALALERVVTAQLNEQVRERCESDPNWFLTGPLNGRPLRDDPRPPDPDGLGPRPKPTEQPYELFAYDEDFTGTSTAAPRFPQDLKIALRQSAGRVTAPFATKDGNGVQVGAWTGWLNGPCTVFLGRMRPAPKEASNRAWMFAGLTATFFIVAMAAMAPTLRRVRRLARDAQASVRQEYGSIAPDSKKKDEIGAITFAYNDAAKELHLRRAAIGDRDEALRRYVASTGERVAAPLAALTAHLGEFARSGVTGAGADGRLHRAFQDAQEVSDRLQNLIAAARLRGRGEPLGRETVNLAAIASKAVTQAQNAAHAAGVTLTASLPQTPVTVTGDAALFERGIANLIDNAIRYNRRGGVVTVTLAPAGGAGADGRFSLRVSDSGTGVTEEEFKSLTAIRRFRGDEDRTRQPGTPGLGLAVARETAERFGFTMSLRQPAAGGLEVEWAGASK